MNDWLYKNEDFEPSNNKYAHIDKSLSAFEKLLSKFKHINIGEKFRAIYFQNPLIKFILLIGLAPEFPKIFTKVGIRLIKSMDRTRFTILSIFYVFLGVVFFKSLFNFK